MSRRTRKEILEDRLTADQLKAVYLLLDNELAPEGSRMSQDEIAAECNVNRSTLYRWRTQNQDFIDYRREVTRNYISDMSGRSEEHTSELQSRGHLVCRLLLEKKKESNSFSISRSTRVT